MIYTTKYYHKGEVHPKIIIHNLLKRLPQIVSNLFHVIMCKLTGYIQV